jgi:hypothetical protein
VTVHPSADAPEQSRSWVMRVSKNTLKEPLPKLTQPGRDASTDVLKGITDETDEMADSARVSSVSSVVGASHPFPTCLIRGCTEPAIDIAYCTVHRRMADDGSLWLRCVFDEGHAPVAPNDPIACAEHRRQIDAEPMPWDVPEKQEGTAA